MKPITRQVQLFERTDKIVKVYLALILKRFRKVQRTLSFDDVHILNAVNEEWKQIDKLMRDCLFEVVLYYYRYVREEADDMEVQLWFAKLIDQPDPVTHYIFFPESDRKRARLIEGIYSVVTLQEKKKELDKAERYIAKQLTQTADDYTIWSLIEAMREAGFKNGEWVTQKDEKVCEECGPRDGKIYPLDELLKLMPAHYGCRCYVIPV